MNDLLIHSSNLETTKDQGKALSAMLKTNEVMFRKQLDDLAVQLWYQYVSEDIKAGKFNWEEALLALKNHVKVGRFFPVYNDLYVKACELAEPRISLLKEKVSDLVYGNDLDDKDRHRREVEYNKVRNGKMTIEDFIKACENGSV